MEKLVFDLETYLIGPASNAPKPVVASFRVDGGEPFLTCPDEIVNWLGRALDNKALVIGQNIAYDMSVTMNAYPEATDIIWALYREGLVRDTMIRERLLMLAEGRLKYDFKNKTKPKFHLANLAEKYLGEDLSEEKNNEYSWRYRYSELDGVPLEEWPEAARLYALADAEITDEVFEAQGSRRRQTPEGYEYADGKGNIVDEVNQVAHAFALTLQTAWGLRTDPVAVEKLKNHLEETVREKRAKLTQFFRRGGSMDTKAVQAAVERAYKAKGEEVPQTKSGGVSRDRTTLEDSGDPELQLLAEYSADVKELTTYIPLLEEGTYIPIHPRYNSLKATGRTSSYQPNIQNMPRREGVRQCFIPRPGHLFISADYASLELAALAQVLIDLFGESDMAKAINEGKDLHVWTGSFLLGMDYEEALAKKKAGDKEIKHARQAAKVANFGFPGGLGTSTLITYAREGYGMRLSEDDSAALKKAWRAAFPEVIQYFKMVSQDVQATGRCNVIQHRSGRVRGQCTYTQSCNTRFQGLAADGAKLALFNVMYEAFADRDSPLYGARGGAFIHDEIMLEVPEDRAADAAVRLSEIMVETMKIFTPDIRIEAEPALMRRWYKEAEPVYDEDGKLIPWEPNADT